MALVENTIAYQVIIKRWGIRRQIPRQVLASLMPGERELVEKKMVSASKKILESKEYDKIVSRDGYAARWLTEHSVPSILKKGVYCIPTVLCHDVDYYMECYKQERKWELVPAFLDVYTQQAEQARVALGEALFSVLEYPSLDAMRKLFDVQTQYITFDVPTALKSVSEEMFRREKERVESLWQEAERQVNQLLLMECQELVGGLQAALQGLNDGTLKKFRDANVVNLQEWAGLFLEARNVTENQELEEVVRKIQATLQGMTGQALKADFMQCQKKVKGALQEAQVALKGMLEEMPERMIDLGE